MEEGVAQPETWEKVLYLEEILSFENLWNIQLAFLKEAEAMSFTKQCKLFYELWRYEFPPPGSLSEAIPNFSPTRDANLTQVSAPSEPCMFQIQPSDWESYIRCDIR